MEPTKRSRRDKAALRDDEIWAVLLRTRMVSELSARAVQSARARSSKTRVGLARAHVLLRRAHWVLQTGKRLPHIVPHGAAR